MDSMVVLGVTAVAALAVGFILAALVIRHSDAEAENGLRAELAAVYRQSNDRYSNMEVMRSYLEFMIDWCRSGGCDDDNTTEECLTYCDGAEGFMLDVGLLASHNCPKCRARCECGLTEVGVHPLVPHACDECEAVTSMITELMGTATYHHHG